jgi:3'(2'), 5'-bisphosphate nucleotidase
VVLTTKEIQSLADFAILIARDAGKLILSYYKNTGMDIYIKSDYSPFTVADLASHDLIINSLLETGFPIVSEESKELPFDSEYYWLVDPLDGTKDFIANTDEFTVNIALIYHEKPILGVVYAPALDELYAGIHGLGAWMEQGPNRKLCRTEPESQGLRMAISRFHDHAETHVFAKKNHIEELLPLGAALKFGRLAMAKIDVYLRIVGTSEWDSAAGQAVLEAAGGKIIDLETCRQLNYGKKNRRNRSFIAFRYPYQFDDFEI